MTTIGHDASVRGPGVVLPPHLRKKDPRLTGDASLKGRMHNVIGRAEMFDAQESANRAAAAQVEAIREPFSQEIERLRGSQVRRGRLNTGFGFQDEDRLFNRFSDVLARDIALRSLEVNRQELAGIGLSGELLSAGLDRQTAEENAKRKKRGGLLGTIGAIGGTLIGGPGLGTTIGGLIGNAAGNYMPF